MKDNEVIFYSMEVSTKFWDWLYVGSPGCLYPADISNLYTCMARETGIIMDISNLMRSAPLTFHCKCDIPALYCSGLRVISEDYSWGQFLRIVDIGGSSGSVLQEILRKRPSIRGLVCDQESVHPAPPSPKSLDFSSTWLVSDGVA